MGEKEIQLEIGLRQAIDWIAAHRQQDPRTSLAELIDQASRRFDLSPVQAEFLYRHLTRAASE